MAEAQAQQARKAILLEARIRGISGLESNFGAGFSEIHTGEHSLSAPITEFGFRGESSRDSARGENSNSRGAFPTGPVAVAAAAAAAAATAYVGSSARLAPGAPAPRARSNSGGSKLAAATTPRAAAAAEGETPAAQLPKPTGAAKRKSTAPQRHAGKRPLVETAAAAAAAAAAATSEVADDSSKPKCSSSSNGSSSELSSRCSRLEGDLAAAEEARLEAVKLVEALRNEMDRLRRDHDARFTAVQSKSADLCSALELTLRSVALTEARENRKALSRDEFELGRASFSMGREAWVDGDADRSLKSRAAVLLEKRETLDRARKDDRKTKRQRRSKEEEDNNNNVIEAVAEEEGRNAQLARLKREEADLTAERLILERRKMKHLRESQRAKSEEASRWRDRPKMNERYVLLSLLGRGGFSEVWLAFDLEESYRVAVKFHTVEPSWPDDKKKDYIRHTAREFDIQKQIDHPRVVRCLDVFEVDGNTMAMVLEFCAGEDLDARLRASKSLNESEARAVLLQVIAGLRCLHTAAIIHYDLKPGNIVFDAQGDAKITDFGLSKVISDNVGTSLELTSQGAGTYWYLPPECFILTPGAPPRISGKVDVWSLGVVFYQMLYGKRPFGEGQSQQQLLTGGTMLRATSVEFPEKPAVSQSAKDFLRAALTHSQSDRLDIHQCCQHEYIIARPSTATARSSTSVQVTPKTH